MPRLQSLFVLGVALVSVSVAAHAEEQASPRLSEEECSTAFIEPAATNMPTDTITDPVGEDRWNSEDPDPYFFERDLPDDPLVNDL